MWTSAGVSAGIDMALAFIADQAGEESAGQVQLAAEYYSSTKSYGGTHKQERAPLYARRPG